jgi:hypothetical protein
VQGDRGRVCQLKSDFDALNARMIEDLNKQSR